MAKTPTIVRKELLYNTCPICGEPAEKVHDCVYKCSICKNGHIWHFCPKHRCRVPRKLENHNPRSCTCEPEKERIVTIP